MIYIKLIVLFVYVLYSSCFNNYCEICRNHTLCLFNEGPSVACKSYNNTALLRRVEINEIVNRINERRNYIALGLNKNLPQAANMKKISWSSKLAAFAQRWVDQCDPSLQLDKEDQCRDLAHIKVGQNVATILGPTSGLNVKSFVEMWYIQILKYKGDVTYYNQSRHHNTDYFTQLIWAETDSVGCGKARFYVEFKNTIVERLVCNFAPKGNIHGKPVYTIGYPGTQCPNNMIPDSTFTALCVNRDNSTARRFTTMRSHVSSLLRILNLSNSSIKQEIDPIRNNLRLINNTSYNSKDQRNQKIRHVYFNHTHGGMKRVAPLRKQNFWNPSMNVSYINHNQQERGHSRVYHGHESHVHNHDTHGENNDPNYRKFDFSTDSMNLYSYSDSRKHYMDHNYRCTRKTKPPSINSAGNECNTPGCTRGQINDNCHQLTTICHSSTFYQNLCAPTKWNSFNQFCSCNKYSPCYTTPTRCACGVKCGCINMGITTCCPKMLRTNDNMNPDETRKSQEYKLYDVPSPLVVRSGDEKITITNSSPKAAPKYIKLIEKNQKWDRI
ncbi:uncharacterized protein LOC115449577 isoform X1 [Manduca sexta]|uniref:uncharacterized protein LOC115449577 isoform X1 n=3 Tax=Manduca sexta TaxID=7130 RepID=UPI00188EB9AD|nr:uncharacterized protein LOC115449577 isoform X1 [Manduca sexta]XP_030033295.2 uncharacterized protein LOC115449577 isoform X1 [Manduca sexta]